MLKAVIVNILGIANITDIADIVVETGRYIQGVTKASHNKV